MYRILIVDDEPYTADDMFELLTTWRHADLDVYRTYSGIEALELLNKTKIDIVISDIRMPVMDGIELLEKVHINWPRCKFIFLTGYNDFDYIHNAMRNGVINYILKTEGEEEILNAVEKAISELDRELKDEQRLTLATEQLHKAIPIMQQEFLHDLLQGEKPSADVRNKRFRDLEIQMDSNSDVLLLVGKVDSWPEKITPSERTKLLYTIQIIAGQYLLSFCDLVPIVFERSLLVWFIQPKNKEDIWERIVILVKESMESIQASCRELLKIAVSFILSSRPVQWDKVDEKYEHLKSILSFGLGYGNEMLLIDNVSQKFGQETLKESKTFIRRIGSKAKDMELLKTYMENGQKDDAMICLRNILNIDGISCRENLYFNLELYYSIINLLFSYINRWGLAVQITSKIEISRVPRVEDCDSWNDAAAYLLQLTGIILECKASSREKRTKDIIAVIQQYISDHINDDISLIKLAEVVYLNPDYLSRIYKQITGTNLSDYINEIRFQRARELLEKNSLKIHEIAAAIGYESAPYFSRYFKKETGITPQEYRDKVSSNRDML